MSTRALYTFKGEKGEGYQAQDWNVYKHHDGYPTGAAATLAVAQAWFAWEAPRYESDEFACAFIAAAKCHGLTPEGFDAAKLKEYGPGSKYHMGGGGARLMPQGDPTKVAQTNCSDIEYRYEISQDASNVLRIAGFKVSLWDDRADEKKIIDCKLEDFPKVAAEYEKEKNDE